eukprot:15147341-Alexandrium_andersonii.AAC.1
MSASSTLHATPTDWQRDGPAPVAVSARAPAPGKPSDGPTTGSAAPSAGPDRTGRKPSAVAIHQTA